MNIPAAGMWATSEAQRAAWAARSLPAVEQVRPGVWAIPVPVQRIPIRFTFAYLIRDGREAVLIDPGESSPEATAAIDAAFSAVGMRADELTGIIVTHYHFDHWEGVDALAERSGAWVALGSEEWTWVTALDDAVLSPDTSAERFRAHGAPQEAAASFARIEDYRHTREHPMPQRLLRDGEEVRVGSVRLRVVWTPGHSPGHICLFDPDRRLLFSGDHVLPGITPHVAQNPFGAALPLVQYLESLDRVGAIGAEEVLPGHEYRFAGLSERLDQLRAEILERHALVRSARERAPEATAWDIAAALPWSRPWDAFPPESRRMALVETAAHVAALGHLPELSRRGGLGSST